MIKAICFDLDGVYFLNGKSNFIKALVDLGVPEDEAARRVIEDVREAVRGGASLSTALDRQHGTFSRLFVNMVRAGESGGILDEILKRLAVQQEKNDSIKKKVKSAMTYPMVLVIITVGAFFGLMFFVILHTRLCRENPKGKFPYLP